MAKGNQATIRIEWIRSGIAFNRNQEEAVRGLGLRRLHHVVERQDNPVVRGLIAKVQHLVRVVGPAKLPAWASIAEYTIVAKAVTPGQSSGVAEPSAAAPKSAAVPDEPESAAESEAEAKPKRRARAPKAQAASEETATAEAKD